MKATPNLIGGLCATLVSLPVSAALVIVDPDTTGINDGDDISTFFTGSGVTLSAVGGSSSDGKVYAYESSSPPTGSLVFGWNDGYFLDDHWGRATSPTFKATFSGSLPNQVKIDYITDGTITLTAYDSSDNVLGSVFAVGDFDPHTLTFTSSGYDIKWISVGISGSGLDAGLLDNLQITVVPEPGAVGLVSGLAALGFIWWRRRTA